MYGFLSVCESQVVQQKKRLEKEQNNYQWMLPDI